MDEENPPTTEASPMVASEGEGSETQSDSDPTPASSNPLENVLARLTLDPWYKSANSWEAWADKEFFDEAFCALLERARVLQAILISRKDDDLHRAAFVAYWLCKCVFGEYPYYAMKPLYFQLVVKISTGTSFPLAAMFFVQFHTQLDLLHTDEMAAFESRQKLAKMPKAVAARFDFLKTNVPIIYRWIGSKFYDLELVPSLDEEESMLWRSYGASYRGYSCSSVMSRFSKVEPQNYAIGPDDMRTLSYLSATSAGWLPVLTLMVIDSHPIVHIDTILEVVIPSGERVGIFTMGMNHYWRDLMTSMLEFRNGGNESIEHLLYLCKAPPNLQLFVATNTVTTKRHPSAWFKANLNNIPAPKKVASKRGKRVTIVASSSKKKKSITKAKKSCSRGIVIKKPMAKTPQPEEQATPMGSSSKKTVRKTRAKRKRSTALPSPALLKSLSTNTRSKKRTTTTYSEARGNEDSSTSLAGEDQTVTNILAGEDQTVTNLPYSEE
uniref:Aminotransferase-like plant mobile domain-containing protein n=1 Tax=Fagus sylvatica TaxID=28930 RepID=A0A2N9JB30_FAGSY